MAIILTRPFGFGNRYTAISPTMSPRLAKETPDLWMLANDEFRAGIPFDFARGIQYTAVNGPFEHTIRPDGSLGFGITAGNGAVYSPDPNHNYLSKNNGVGWTIFFGDFFFYGQGVRSYLFASDRAGPVAPHYDLDVWAGRVAVRANGKLFRAFNDAIVLRDNEQTQLAVSFDGGNLLTLVSKSFIRRGNVPQLDTIDIEGPWSEDGPVTEIFFSRNLTGGNSLHSSVASLIVIPRYTPEIELFDWALDPHAFWERPIYFPVSVVSTPPSNDVEVDLPSASLVHTPYAPTVDVEFNVLTDLPSASINLTPYDPTVDTVEIGEDVEVNLPAGFIDILEYDPVVQIIIPSEDIFVDLPATAELQLAGFGPDVSVAEDVFVDVPSANIDLTPYDPMVDVGGGTFINLPAGALQLTPYAPTVEVGGDAEVDLPAAQIDLEGFAPEVLVQAGVYVDLPSAMLSYTPHDPIVQLMGDVICELPAAQLNLVPIPVRVMVGEDVDDEVPDQGIAGPVLADIAVEPTGPIKT